MAWSSETWVEQPIRADRRQRVSSSMAITGKEKETMRRHAWRDNEAGMHARDARKEDRSGDAKEGRRPAVLTDAPWMKGAISRGASLCPRKMLAAAHTLSSAEVPIRVSIKPPSAWFRVQGFGIRQRAWDGWREKGREGERKGVSKRKKGAVEDRGRRESERERARAGGREGVNERGRQRKREEGKSESEKGRERGVFSR
eukprot:740952-Rhodomonas_salina.2